MLCLFTLWLCDRMDPGDTVSPCQGCPGEQPKQSNNYYASVLTNNKPPTRAYSYHAGCAPACVELPGGLVQSSHAPSAWTTWNEKKSHRFAHLLVFITNEESFESNKTVV